MSSDWLGRAALFAFGGALTTYRDAFLTVYDYGQGGRWCVVMAASEAQIAERYPELTVIHEWPPWMAAKDETRLSIYDIDDEPKGVLVALVADRESAG